MLSALSSLKFIIKNWRALAIALACIALFAVGWRYGVFVTDARWQKAMHAAEAQAESDRIALAQQNAEIIEQESNHEQKVRTRIKYITRTIAATADSVCLNADSVRIWNSASAPAGSPGQPANPVQPAIHPGG